MRTDSKINVRNELIMREIIIQCDKLRGRLFNEKEMLLYKIWFAEYMKDTLAIYMKSIYAENIQWLSLATNNASFGNWISQHMQFKEHGNYEKYESENITVFERRPLGQYMSCNQLIVLLVDYFPSLYMLDAVSSDIADIHDQISHWSVFIQTYQGDLPSGIALPVNLAGH